MTYEELANFIDHGMRMSHIYQPVMIIELLSNQGVLKNSDVAKTLLSHDQSQIEYNTAITNNMVGRVLCNRSLVSRDRTAGETGYRGKIAIVRSEPVAHQATTRLMTTLDLLTEYLI